MMYQKAIMFDDLDTADKILQSTEPKEQKALGREVKNFDAKAWDMEARDIVYVGNFNKFIQNEQLLKKLMATGHRTLVEASPYDKIWGIGFDEAAAKRTPKSEWKGTIWLGLELTRLRNNINEARVS
jgi:hypothetical protein